MKKVHVSFGNEKYYKSLDILKESSKEIGKVDHFRMYTQEWLKGTDFWNKNAFILNQPRGAGYWIWKPYIILDSFEYMETGDTLIYSDAGLKVIDDLSPLFQIAATNDSGRMIFRLPWVGAKHIAKIWTKRDCFKLMGCDEEKYWNAPMSNGAVSVWRKSEENISFLKMWLGYLRNPNIVTDSSNLFGVNHMEFKDHRHDQSVLSILAVKYNWIFYRDPTQFGNEEIELFDNSPYSQLFNHHRNPQNPS